MLEAPPALAVLRCDCDDPIFDTLLGAFVTEELRMKQKASRVAGADGKCPCPEAHAAAPEAAPGAAAAALPRADAA